MRNFRKYLVFFVLLIAMTAPVSSELTKETVDSMFVIASSGAMKYRDMVQPTMDDMAKYGVEVIPFLMPQLGTTDARERITLRQIFQKIGPTAVPSLNDALLTTDSLMLSRVCLFLYYIPDSSSVTNLLKVTDNDYYWVRYQSIRALGKIGDDRAVSAIRSALSDENELVRTMAAVAAGNLKNLNHPDLLSALLRALKDGYYGVRMSARDALTKLNCDAKAKLFLNNLSNLPAMPINLLLSIIAADSCSYDFKLIQPFLANDQSSVYPFALEAAEKIKPGFSQSSDE